MKQEIRTTIRSFLAATFQNHDLQDDEDIFSLGVVTSLFAMQLVLFIENTFQVTFDNSDLEIDNFRTIRAMTRLVERNVAAVAAD